MHIKEILKFEFNYAEYIVTEGNYDVICLCLSVPLPNNEVPLKGMEVEMIYPFTFNTIDIKINNDKKEFLIQKKNSHFEYNLRGMIINKERALVKIENFVICLEKDFEEGFNNQYQIGDFIEFRVDRLDCELKGYPEDHLYTNATQSR